MFDGITYQLMKFGFSLHCSIAHLTMILQVDGDCIKRHVFSLPPKESAFSNYQIPLLLPVHTIVQCHVQNGILLYLVFGCKKVLAVECVCECVGVLAHASEGTKFLTRR